MQTFLFVAATVLLVNIVVGALRVSRGPGPRDRISGLVLLSTTGTAVLLVLAEAMNQPALRITGAVLVSLAVVIVAALVVHERQGAP